MRQELETFGRDLSSIRKLVQRPFQPILTVIESKLGEIEDVVSALRNELGQKVDWVAGQQSDRLAQEARTLGKFIEEWGRYLDSRVQEEGTGTRKSAEEAAKAAESRMTEEAEESRALIERSMEKSAKDVERHTKSAASNVTRLKEELQAQLAQAEEALRADVEAAQEALLDGVEETSEAVTEALGQMPAIVQKQIADSVAENVKPIWKEVRQLTERIDEASERLTQANNRIEAVQTSLVGYLAERDERLEKVRDQALVELVDKMSDALKGKAKLKVIEALREGDQRRKDERDAARYREMGEGGPPAATRAADWPRNWTDSESTGGEAPWLSDSK